jgi:hypothetical protein
MFDLVGKIKHSDKVLDFECGNAGLLAEAARRGNLSMKNKQRFRYKIRKYIYYFHKT